jgi:hypothetical protein
MNLYDLTLYVVQDIDDNYTSEEVGRWFNKAIANYNLIPPVTNYPQIEIDAEYEDYTHLNDTFFLAVVLPFISSSVRSSESSLSEKQLFLQEFMMNARTYKSAFPDKTYLINTADNPEIDLYRIGENVYLTDFNQSPFAGDWKKASAYKEVTITRNDNNEIIKYVDDSLVDEDI